MILFPGIKYHFKTVCNDHIVFLDMDVSQFNQSLDQLRYSYHPKAAGRQTEIPGTQFIINKI